MENDFLRSFETVFYFTEKKAGELMDLFNFNNICMNGFQLS